MFRVRSQIGCDGIAGEYTGKNVVVAVLDTGISPHPDFDSRIIGFKDFINGRKGIYDDSGHGTHVSGIIGGSGRLSQGRYRGIAPGCRLVVGKVLNGSGDGSVEHMRRAVEWVLENQHFYHIRILNISVGLGQMGEEPAKRYLTEWTQKAWDRGIVVVAAAGNNGPMPGTISPIGASKKVITVGCHDGGYFGMGESLCEYYSGRGPSEHALKKPDIVAPGTDIVSCNGHLRKGIRGYQNPYITKSGTSMATPIVSGAAALYLQKVPMADNEEVKRKLVYTATDLREPWTKQGWGMLNVAGLLED